VSPRTRTAAAALVFGVAGMLVGAGVVNPGPELVGPPAGSVVVPTWRATYPPAAVERLPVEGCGTGCSLPVTEAGSLPVTGAP